VPTKKNKKIIRRIRRGAVKARTWPPSSSGFSKRGWPADKLANLLGISRARHPVRCLSPAGPPTILETRVCPPSRVSHYKRPRSTAPTRGPPTILTNRPGTRRELQPPFDADCDLRHRAPPLHPRLPAPSFFKAKEFLGRGRCARSHNERFLSILASSTIFARDTAPAKFRTTPRVRLRRNYSTRAQ